MIHTISCSYSEEKFDGSEGFGDDLSSTNGQGWLTLLPKMTSDNSTFFSKQRYTKSNLACLNN